MKMLLRVFWSVACSLSIAAGSGVGCHAPESPDERTGAASAALTKVTETVAPADARGIRAFPDGEPFLLDFLAIKENTADRTVIELDLAPIEGQLGRAKLNLGIENFDLDTPDPGIIDIHTFPGDGTVTPDEFFAGTFFKSFTFDRPPGVISVDITAAVAARLAAGDRYLGVRLTAATTDRYFLGASVAQPEPSLTFTMLVRGPLDAIAEAKAALEDVCGADPLLQKLRQAAKKIEQGEARFTAGHPAPARQAFCQARTKLDDFLAKVPVLVSSGHLTTAQGNELVALAEEAQDLLDERLLHLGLAACDP